MDAHPTEQQKIAITVSATARPTGDAGVSTISSAAGRKAVSSALGLPESFGKETMFLANFMEARLQTMEIGVASGGADQLVVGTVLDDSALFDCNNAVGPTHGRQPMRNDQNRA